MRILMQSRSNFNSLPGGDTIQLLKTKEQLEQLGVQVEISLEWNPDLTNYDLVHLSNITRIQETYLQVQNAKKQNKPIILSTIFWPMEEFEKQGQTGIRKLLNRQLKIDEIERIKAIARLIKDRTSRNIATKNLITIGYTEMQKYVISNTDIFLPNSEMEMQKLCETFNFNSENYIVVPNGIDIENARKALREQTISEFEQYRDAIICVGRIETRKNQLALIKALEGSDYKLVLVGSASKNHENYFHEVMSYIKKNKKYFYIPKIENDKLYQLYKVCKVNALPSWLDTPGLVNLESAAMGCNLAISTKGSTMEYFQNEAYYCEPDNLESIRKAVDSAYKAPKNKNLQNMIFEKYTWKEAAKKTLEGYRRLGEK